MLYLSNADVQAILDMPTCLEALRAGYADLARGDAAYAPRIELWAPTGRPEDYYAWGSMAGVCRTTGTLAVRIKSDVIAWPEGRTQEKWAVEPGTYSGIILLYRIDNGEPIALLNDGVIQHMRVGAVAGIGVDVLARRDATVLGLIGSGGMARTFLQAIALVRPLELVKIYSPTAAHREAFATEMGAELGLEVVPLASSEAVVRGSDIVATATDSMEPTFDAAWIEPGTHVTCVTRRELDKRIVGRADVVIQLGHLSIAPGTPIPGLEWPQSGVAAYVTGQPHERERLPWKKQVHTEDHPLLVDVQTGRVSGRSDPGQVTLFITTGTQGLQFAAVAGRVYQLALERGIGTPMPREWFLQDIRD